MQPSKKNALSRAVKSGKNNDMKSNFPLKSKEKKIDLSDAPLTASLGSILEHPISDQVNQDSDTATKKMELSDRTRSESSGDQSDVLPASWKDTFLMVGGAVVVAALLEGARRFTGKKFGSSDEETTSDSSAEKTSLLSDMGDQLKSAKEKVFAKKSSSGAKRGKNASSEPGKRISKSATALKKKSEYISTAAGKTSSKKKKNAPSKTSATRTGKKASSSGRRSARAI